jgi:hypothetical protein
MGEKARGCPKGRSKTSTEHDNQLMYENVIREAEKVIKAWKVVVDNMFN